MLHLVSVKLLTNGAKTITAYIDLFDILVTVSTCTIQYTHYLRQSVKMAYLEKQNKTHIAMLMRKADGMALMAMNVGR